MTCVVFLQTMHLLIEEPPRRRAERSKRLLIFTPAMLALGVAFVSGMNFYSMINFAPLTYGTVYEPE